MSKLIDELRLAVGAQLDKLERDGLYVQHIYVHDEPRWGELYSDPDRPPRDREIVVELTTKEPEYSKRKKERKAG